MTDFLYRLADRNLATASVAEPLIKPIFGPGPNVPSTVEMPVEHTGLESTADRADDSREERHAGASIDSPLVVEREALSQATNSTVPCKTDRTSRAAQSPTDEFLSPHQSETHPYSPTGSIARLEKREDFLIGEERAGDETETSRAPADTGLTNVTSTLSTVAPKHYRKALHSDRPSLAAQNPTNDFQSPRQNEAHLYSPPGSIVRLDRGGDFLMDEESSDEESSIDETEPSRAAAEIEPADVTSTPISTAKPKRHWETLHSDRASLAAEIATDDMPRRKATPISSPGGAPDLPKQDGIAIDREKWADENEILHSLTEETREPVDIDPSRTISTVISAREPKQRNEPPDFRLASPGAHNPTSAFENRRREVLPLSGARFATGGADEPEEARKHVAVHREPDTKSLATEKIRRTAQTPPVKKSEDTARAGFSIPIVVDTPDDEVRFLNRGQSPTPKPRSEGVEWLDSDSPAQQPAQQPARQSDRLVAAAVRSKDESTGVLPDSFGTGHPRPPLVVAPRIVRDNAMSGRYATDQPSVRPVADPIASRRESDAVTAPAIRVTIGRIEVRAVHAPPAPPQKRAPRPAPRVSLDDYLRKRNGGSR